LAVITHHRNLKPAIMFIYSMASRTFMAASHFGSASRTVQFYPIAATSHQEEWPIRLPYSRRSGRIDPYV